MVSCTARGPKIQPKVRPLLELLHHQHHSSHSTTATVEVESTYLENAPRRMPKSLMNRERRQRTKTFTGCWTCRSRRVKCDEQTPHCRRCSQFGVDCEGYGVRLTWLTGGGEDHSYLNSEEDANEVQAPKTRRSRCTFGNVGARPALRLPSPEIDAMLERIDDCPAGSSRSENGVFSVFAVRTPTSTPTPERPASEGLVEETPSTAPCSDQGRLQGSLLHATPRVGLQFDEDALGTPTDVGNPLHQQHQKFSPATTEDRGRAIRNSFARDPASFPAGVVAPNNNTCAETGAHIPEILLPRLPPKQQPSRHLDLLCMPASQKRLIHHWVTFTSGKIALLDEPNNPCRTMMLPMALRGLMSSSENSTADIATFHAICACAAYNLSELGGRKNEEDRKLAWEHDQQAIRYLRHNLTEVDQPDDQALAMAIMACIVIEAISGNTGRWRVHVTGGLAYLSNLRARTAGTDASAPFQAHLVSMAILCGCEVPVEFKSFLDGAEALEFRFPYYGASGSFLSSLDRMNTLAAAAAAEDHRPEPQELDAFELQLYLNFPLGARGSSLPETQATVLHHMMQAFYYASLVFFQRSIKRAHIDSVQTLVESGVAQLEAVESVGQGAVGSVIMWPALVLGAECGSCELQARMQAWFQKKHELGFRHVRVMQDMARSLWSSRACGDTERSWRDLIVQDRFDVFRI